MALLDFLKRKDEVEKAKPVKKTGEVKVEKKTEKKVEKKAGAVKTGKTKGF